jgi:hypothetical protein
VRPSAFDDGPSSALGKTRGKLGRSHAGAICPAREPSSRYSDQPRRSQPWYTDRPILPRKNVLERHAADIRGHVLECYDRIYTTRFGDNRSDVLNIEPDNPNSTFVGDLAGNNNLPTEAFDCIIFTQVLRAYASHLRYVGCNVFQSKPIPRVNHYSVL